MPSKMHWFDGQQFSSRTKRLMSALRQDILGNESIIQEIGRAYERLLQEGSMQNRPAGAFLVLGSIGSGKTTLVNALTKFLLGDVHSNVELAGSMFADPSMLGTLIDDQSYDEDGSFPGPVYPLTQERLDFYGLDTILRSEGWRKLKDEIDELAQAIEKLDHEYMWALRRRECEKMKQCIAQLEQMKDAHEKIRKDLIIDCETARVPSVLYVNGLENTHPSFVDRFLMPIIDAGFFKLGSGRPVDCRRCFVVIDASVGIEELAEIMEKKRASLGFGRIDQSKAERDVEEVVKEVLPRDLFAKVTRLDFKTPDDKLLSDMLHLEMQKLVERFPSRTFKYSKAVWELLLKKILSRKNEGGWAVVRVLREFVETPLATLVNRGEIGEGETKTIFLDVKNDALRFGVRR